MARKTSVGLIQKYLDRVGLAIHHSLDEPTEKEGVVLTGWQTGPTSPGFMLIIDPMVERGLITFSVRGLLQAPQGGVPDDRLITLLIALSALNGQIILGKFAYNPGDGEVVFQVGMPLDGGKLAYGSFEKCIQAAVTMSEAYAPQLKGIVEGTSSLEDVLGT